MEKIKNTSKSKEEVEAIKVACENSGIDFEHRGIFWEGIAGEVLFNLESVWWLQKILQFVRKNSSFKQDTRKECGGCCLG